MFVLLIGFITPAIIFAIFGIIACLRRSSSALEVEEDKEYRLVDPRIPLRYELAKRQSYTRGVSLNIAPVGYHHFFAAPTVGMPPSYSEATSIPQLLSDRGTSNESTDPSLHSKHLPPNQPRVRPALPSTSSAESIIIGF